MDLCYDLLRGGIVTSLDLCARGISFVSTLPSWLEKGSQHLPNWSHNWEGIANWTLEAKNSIEQSLCLETWSPPSLDELTHLNLTEFQFKLIREFCLILLGNCLLVALAWKIYGPRIERKFLKSDDKSKESSKAVIEKLRLSMSELQLPKEHDYKYK